jgi:hypothetical protein
MRRAQIELEQLRGAVAARNDLIRRERIRRVEVTLDYAARYFHSVYQDYEDCIVLRKDHNYIVEKRCHGLSDFLGRRGWRQTDDSCHSEQAKRLDPHFKVLEDALQEPKDRFEALEEIIKISSTPRPNRKPDVKRYRIVATQCINLATADLHRALRKARWGIAPSPPARREANTARR